MKTAVSLPDDLFENAERLSKTLGVSRSELYRRALSRYIEQYDEQALIDAINAVCDADPEATKPDSALERMQFSRLPREEW
ncbi:MAG: ribbon-helix-helix protein, CopG family [Candidatus Hydrogenedentes bacterium]|nr:ribbon-helix-helix protein, CopG family [Candidatus Hydrogenedentota bacterium]